MKDPWNKGADAAENGADITDNPYEEGTEEYDDWEDGWHFGQDDDDEELEDDE
jgi:hypothetical protein